MGCRSSLYCDQSLDEIPKQLRSLVKCGSCCSWICEIICAKLMLAWETFDFQASADSMFPVSQWMGTAMYCAI